MSHPQEGELIQSRRFDHNSFLLHRWNTILPLTAILLMTALKEIYEDIQRGRQDDKINKRKVKVLIEESN